MGTQAKLLHLKKFMVWIEEGGDKGLVSSKICTTLRNELVRKANSVPANHQLQFIAEATKRHPSIHADQNIVSVIDKESIATIVSICSHLHFSGE